MNSESKSRIVHENLDTTFVNLWALLRNLSQRGFIGRVRVELKDYTADVFMTGSSTPLVHEIDRAAGTDTLEEAALHRLVLRVRETPGTISVFEGPDEAVAVQGTANPATETDGSRSVRESQERNPLVHHEADKAAITISDEPILRPDIETRIPIPSSTQIGESVAPTAEPMDEIEWGAIVKASGELIGGVERALTGTVADFASLFDTFAFGLFNPMLSLYLQSCVPDVRNCRRAHTHKGEPDEAPACPGLLSTYVNPHLYYCGDGPMDADRSGLPRVEISTRPVFSQHDRPDPRHRQPSCER